ncbi:MAG: glycosyltransferase [Vicinamibacterales bacterium]
MTLTVVMPCYNERATIREIVGHVQAVDLGDVRREILIDDGSWTAPCGTSC